MDFGFLFYFFEKDALERDYLFLCPNLIPFIHGAVKPRAPARVGANLLLRFGIAWMYEIFFYVCVGT